MTAFYFTPWMWFIAALVFLIIELMAPGAWFVWLAIAAGATGLLAFQLPFLGPELQAALFAGLAILSTWAGRRFFMSRSGEAGDSGLNRGAERYVGRRLVVVEAIANGEGRVKLGDSIWTAYGDDAALGSVVEVVAVDGAILKVQPVSKPERADKS